MSQFYQYNWPGANPSAIALPQAVLANGTVQLNGGYGVSNNTANLIGSGFGAVVSITGIQATTATFTIKGIQNGIPISEIIVGLFEDQVKYTVKYFDVVTSITLDNNAAPQISVGVGMGGYFPLITLNTEQNTGYISYALSMSASIAAACTYSVFQTFNNPANPFLFFNADANPTNLLFQKGAPVPIPSVTLPVISQYTDVCRALLVSVVTTDVAATVQMQFLQI